MKITKQNKKRYLTLIMILLSLLVGYLAGSISKYFNNNLIIDVLLIILFLIYTFIASIFWCKKTNDIDEERI